jgi:antibiotic biosynthesis monooxygenase (ABM) superfamily enzyme
MYVAMIGDMRRRSWLWAVLMATGLELAMLLTPYPQFFAIPLAVLFVAVTLTAHLIFGVALGLVTKWWARRWQLTEPVSA